MKWTPLRGMRRILRQYRAEEREGIDTTMKELKVKKIRIFKIIKEGLLEEII